MGDESELNTRNPEVQPTQINIPAQSPGNQEPLDATEIFPSEEQIAINPKVKIEGLENIISDIDNSDKLKDIILQSNLETFCNTDLSISATIGQTADTLRNINVIKDELCKLPLDSCEMDFITTNIYPLLNVLYQLSTTSYNLSGSANQLSISSIVHPKRSELKDTIHLVYKINDECEDVYDVLKRRINFVLKSKE